MQCFATALARTLLFAAGVLATPAHADGLDDPAVDLELVLAVDVSRSMDPEEQELQRQGYVSAFRHPEVIQAIGQGRRGRIAVTYLQWAGAGLHFVVVPWTLIAGRADAESFADQIAAAPLRQESGTSISSGLFFAASRINAGEFDGDRRAVDISGDGPNNTGHPVDITRDWLVRQGVTINGLPIMLEANDRRTRHGIPNLDVYYEDCVIGGPGAFMITVDDPSRFEVAIRRKLILEIAGLPPQLIRAAVVGRQPRVDCQIGEKGRWPGIRDRN